MKYVIVHGNCMDGFTAAWVARKALGKGCKIRHVGHSADPFEEIPADAEMVYLFDIAFSRPMMKAAYRKFEGRLQVHDHHKTAFDSLGDLPFCHFDMNKSGAMLAWQHFFPGVEAPWLVRYVQDQDLWKNELPDTRSINALISATKRDFKEWDRLDALTPAQAAALGKGCLMYLDNYIENVISSGLMKTTWLGYKVGVVNCPYPGNSNVLNEVLQRDESIAIAIGWFMDPDGDYVYSLRSRKGRVDVAEIAKQYGGGGHPVASGFRFNRIVF